MNNFRFKLDKTSKKYQCPDCKKKTFVRFVDTETGEYLPGNFGRCDRESKCGLLNLPPKEPQKIKYLFVPFNELIHYSKKAYKIITKTGVQHYLPKSQVYEMENKGCYVSEWYLNEGKILKKPEHLANDYKYFINGNIVVNNEKSTNEKIELKTISLIDVDVFKASLKNYEANHFTKFLIGLFGREITDDLVHRYFIGTSRRWNGATVFWQIDSQDRVRTGKIMLYNDITGRRIRKPFNHITWVHTALKLPGFELRQCMFGEHLLKDNKFIALVESEKAAIIASVYFPQLIWLSVGSLNQLTADKCQILKGRNVILFPDLNGFEKWSSKAKELSHIANFIISDLLQRNATQAEREQGLDLADYLIRFDYKLFTQHGFEPTPREICSKY